MFIFGGTMRTLLKRTLVSAILATTLMGQITWAQNNSPVNSPTESPEVYTLEKSVYYVKLHKIIDQVISIVSSLNMFSLDQLMDQKSETLSLLDFEYRENPEMTVESYERVKHFGGWVKNKKSGDCFNSRNKVLVRENIGTIVLKESNKCSVAQGEWVDPYSGRTMTDAQLEIQIDHMVPMKVAYNSGAYKWTFKERCLYGNYLGYRNHLVAVSGDENNEKGSNTPEDYMPSNPNNQCGYLKDWLKIKAFWGLSLTPEEMHSIVKLVAENNCDKALFVVTKAELEEQQAFFKANANLCR